MTEPLVGARARRSFERMTGPKAEYWLVQTVRAAVGAIGAGLAHAAAGRDPLRSRARARRDCLRAPTPHLQRRRCHRTSAPTRLVPDRAYEPVDSAGRSTRRFADAEKVDRAADLLTVLGRTYGCHLVVQRPRCHKMSFQA